MRIVNSTIVKSFAATLIASPALASGGLPQLHTATFSSQLIWLALTFGILYALMAKIALPKIGNVLEERQIKIDDNLAKAEELKSQADAASEAHQRSLSDARAEAQDAIRTVKNEANAEAAQRQSTLNADLQGKIIATEQVIFKARDAALSGITIIATDVAASAVKKLIGEIPDAATVNAAIEAALKDRS